MKKVNFLHTLTAMFLIAFLLILDACSSSSSNNAPYDLTKGTVTIFGRALIDGLPMEGAQAYALSANGFTVPLENLPVVDHGGFFALHLKKIPTGSFTVFVQTADGLTYANEIVRLTANQTVYVNPVTTLEYAYRTAHPEVSISDAHYKTRTYLGIRAYSHTGDELLSRYYSGFSAREFMDKALAHEGGMVGYMADQTDGIHLVGDTPTGSFTEPTQDQANENMRSFLLDDLNEIDIDAMRRPTVDLFQVSEIRYEGQAAARLPEQVVDEELKESFSIAGAVGEELIGFVLNAVLGLFIPGPDHALLEEVLQELGQIEDDLQQINTEIINMQAYLSKAFTQTNYISCSNAIKNQTDEINMYYGYQQKAAAYSANQDMTDFRTQIFNLNQKTYKNIYEDAMAIHETQFAPSQPGVPSLRSLSRDLTGANSFLSYATIMNLGSQQCYYTSMQVLAIVLIDSLSSPSAFLLPQPPGVKSINTPAGIKNDANSDMDDINSNISEEMSALPYQLLDQTQVYDITNKRLFQGASVSNSTAGTTYNYAASLSSGGLSDWSIASMSGVEGVFGQVPGKPSSYSQALQAYGFKLQPGIVKYHKWTKMVNSQGTSWTDNGDVTATSNGFLTLSIDVSGTATAGWIDDTGKTGTIATFSAGSTIQNSLDGDKTYFAGQSNGYMCTYYYYYGRINGPCIIMYDFNQANCLTNQPPSFLPGILGFYNGFTINSDSVVFDTDNQQAATQQLSAIPKYLSFVPSSFNTYDLTESVYWTSSDPVNAPVSNVPKLHLLTGEDQDPDNTPQFTSQDLTSGIIHWLPGSYGKTVTFTATRFLPNGSTVSGSIDINNNFIFEYAAIHTDAVNIYPVGYTIHGDDLMNYGLYVYVTAHQIDGQFIDITGTANLSTDNPAVNVASDGRVKAASVLPAGTTVTVSVTDTFTMTWNMGFLLPNGTRWFDSCVINIL